MIMNASPSRRRAAWIAALLSVVAPGLGHLYAGTPRRGLGLFAASLAVVPLGAWLADAGHAALGVVAPAGALLGLSGLSALDAARCAGRSGAVRSGGRRWLSVLIIVGVAGPIGAAWHLRASVCEVYYVPTSSMSPTIVPGDRVLGEKRPVRREELRRGDIVIFRPPEEPGPLWLKRVIGLPGDRIEIDRGTVRVNGAALRQEPTGDSGGVVVERHADGTRYRVVPGTGSMEAIVVPPGSCFVLGDRRPQARDSRVFGPLPFERCTGVVSFLLVPAHGWDRIGSLRPER